MLTFVNRGRAMSKEGLSVFWLNSTRPPSVTAKMEQDYKKRLLELCNSEQHARKLYEEHCSKYYPPNTAWYRFNQIAFLETTSSLTPTERKRAQFSVSFGQL